MRKAFTLIELLVVIATLSILMAIITPALQGAKQQARTALCSSNLKQILMALAAYETENDVFPHAFDDMAPHDMLAPPGGYVGNLAHDKLGWWWFHFLDDAQENISGVHNIMRCPSRRIRDIGIKENVLWGNYGVNQSICKNAREISGQEEFTGKPLGMTDISYPGDIMLIVDCGYSMIKWWHVTDNPPVSLDFSIREDTAYIPGLGINTLKPLFSDQEIDAWEGRHPNKTINTGFADFHVSREEAEALYVKEEGGDYHNRTPLWSPR